MEHPPFVDQKTSEKPNMDFHSHGIHSQTQSGTVVGRRQHQLNQHARGEHHLSTSLRAMLGGPKSDVSVDLLWKDFQANPFNNAAETGVNTVRKTEKLQVLHISSLSKWR